MSSGTVSWRKRWFSMVMFIHMDNLSMRHYICPPYISPHSLLSLSLNAFEIMLNITFCVPLKKSHKWWHSFNFLCHYRFQFNMRNMILYRLNKDFHWIQETLQSYSSSGLKKDKWFEIKYYTYGYSAHRCCGMSGGCWYCFSHSGLSNAFLLIWRCSSDWICSRRAWPNCRKLDWVCGIQTKLSSTAKPVDYTNHM